MPGRHINDLHGERVACKSVVELLSLAHERGCEAEFGAALSALLITANQAFGQWSKILPDPAMTLAAVDRLVHHATIFEMNVESYRRRTPSIENSTGLDDLQATRQSRTSVHSRTATINRRHDPCQRHSIPASSSSRDHRLSP